MTPSPEIVVCADRDTFYERAVRRFVQAARTATAARGRFAVALSGGSTPEPLFRRLADPEARDAVPWEATHVFWADERCVPPDHDDSNYRLAKETLLDPVGLPLDRVHRIEGERADPDEAATRYEQELRETLSMTPRSLPHLDLILLGLGADGHTASIFPESAAVGETDRLVVAVRASEPSMQPPIVERITLTPPAIHAAWDALFLVSGESKAPAVAATLEGPRAPREWPAQLVDPVEGGVTWLLDAAAASELSGFQLPAGEAAP